MCTESLAWTGDIIVNVFVFVFFVIFFCIFVRFSFLWFSFVFDSYLFHKNGHSSKSKGVLGTRSGADESYESPGAVETYQGPK